MSANLTHLRRLYAALDARGQVDAVALALSGHVRITVAGGRPPAKTAHGGTR